MGSTVMRRAEGTNVQQQGSWIYVGVPEVDDSVSLELEDEANVATDEAYACFSY